eukprot:Gregarina_sp_Pseudo_9__5332@NODE_62_length_4681_cov_83_747092_g57_i0_p1_GENE_NODE_62_length_4681_cov_83_747092_g57_i0NODE_62_length_4681_cov_83_747092_g57_i0_p1_ORF_typecomplete_len679_score142_16Dcc1/PF09724_9/0_18Dcc1/PF09724_9/0_011_NODE_62_length_4681_cov_83_747092_g57_i01432179
MSGINHRLEPVLDANQEDNTWQWSLIEVEPAILDELLEQLKPADPSSVIGGFAADEQPPTCYLKSAAHSPDLIYAAPEGFEFVALPEVTLPALCTDTRVLSLKQRRLEHVNHLVVKPLAASPSPTLEKENAAMANAPLFLPLRPVVPPTTVPERDATSPYYLVSNVRYTLLGAVVPADYNLLFQLIKDETERRFRKFVLSKERGGRSLDEFEGFGVKEFLTTGIRVPQKVAENEMFRQYPLICLPRKSQDNDFVVIPLDEDKDLAFLASKFFPLLEAHIKKVFEDSGRETVSEFSFFTALYILGCAVDESEYSFSNLLPSWSASVVNEDLFSLTGAGAEKDKLAEYKLIKDRGVCMTSEWIRDPFVACQVLRFLVTSVRNGFDCIIPTAAAKASTDPEYLSALSRLEFTCREMSITQRTGYRMGMNELKVYYLLSLVKRGAKEITPQTLMKLSYGTGVKEKLCAASLFPFQSHVQLSIAPLTTCLKECKEVFSTMFQHFRVPDIAGAMANARNKITTGNIPEKWYFWNWNIGMFGDITKCVITGQLGLKQAQEVIGNTDKEMAMFLALLGGKAFLIDLSESAFASLSSESHITSNASKPASYVVFCDARSLSWNWESRLKDMYRMKRFWPLYELREYVGPLLEHDPSLSLEKIIATYLEPHPTVPGHYQNSSLHLERP